MNPNGNEAFLNWLHDVTVEGYSRDIMISTEHGDFIRECFDAGLSAADALEKYESYLAE